MGFVGAVCGRDWGGGANRVINPASRKPIGVNQACLGHILRYTDIRLNQENTGSSACFAVGLPMPFHVSHGQAAASEHTETKRPKGPAGPWGKGSHRLSCCG